MKSNIAIGIIKNSGGGNSGNAFGQFQSFSKGLNNCVINTETSLQPGDIVNKGWKDANTWWESAIYNGGDVTDMANYTPLIEIIMDTVCGLPDPIPDGGGTDPIPDGGGTDPDPGPDPSPAPIYCAVWTAANNMNSKMETSGYIDFTAMLAGRSIHTTASVGYISSYVISGMTPIACEIMMDFTATRAYWETDLLPAVRDKVLTGLIFTINIICTNATEIDITNGATYAVVEPAPQLSSSYDSCTVNSGSNPTSPVIIAYQVENRNDFFISVNYIDVDNNAQSINQQGNTTETYEAIQGSLAVQNDGVTVTIL